MSDRNRHIPRGLKNSVWSVLDAAIYPAIYLAMVPVILRGLGPAVFGAWIVLNTLMITMQLFNLNIGLTTIRQIALLAGRGNHRAVNLALSAIIRITILLGVGAFGIGIRPRKTG